MKKKHLKFSVILANYNGQKFLVDCLESVFKTRYPNYELIIVEDGSTDRSLEIIASFQKKYPLVLLENKTNLGLVASRNKAIIRAKGDILVFLDNDTQVDKNWLEGLALTFSQDNHIGAAQCLIFDFHQRSIIQQTGMKLVPYTGLATTLDRGKKVSTNLKFPENIISLGAALAVRKNVAKRIGGFDEKLFHYTDDLDFSWRVWIAGYAVVLAPKAKVYHYLKSHKSTYKLYYHLSKNSIRMVIKNYEFKNVIKYLPFAIIINIVGAIFVLLTRASFSGVVGVFFGLSWSGINVFDNLEERKKTMKYRRVKDDDIFPRIMISDNIIDIVRRYFQGARVSTALLKGYKL